jgi:hypothetical protein
VAEADAGAAVGAGLGKITRDSRFGTGPVSHSTRRTASPADTPSAGCLIGEAGGEASGSDAERVFAERERGDTVGSNAGADVPPR